MRKWRYSFCAIGLNALHCSTNYTKASTAVSYRHASTVLQNNEAPDGFGRRLRDALVARLCCPQHPLPRLSIYRELVNMTRIITEFHYIRSSRRLHKQHDALCFLRRHNVLMHSLLYYVEHSASWNVTSEFERLALFGEAVLRAEVHARLLQLFSKITSHFYAECVVQLLHEDALAKLFDELSMGKIVGSRPPPRRRSSQTTVQELNKHDTASEARNAKDKQTYFPEVRMTSRALLLSSRQKSNMLCAIIGEMQWFVDRTKSVDRTHNNALFPPSDVLVLHVLCSHLLECLPAEVIYRAVEPQVNEIRAVWVNEPMSVPAQLHLKPRTPNAMSLCIVPRSALSCSNEVPMSSTAVLQAKYMSTDFVTRSADVKPIPSTATKAVAESPGSMCRPALPESMTLTKERNTNYVKSAMRPLYSHKHFDSSRYRIFAHEVHADTRPSLHTERAGDQGVDNDEVPCLSATDTSHWSDARARELVDLST